MSSIADFEFNRFPLSEGVILVSQAIRRDFPAPGPGRYNGMIFLPIQCAKHCSS